MKPIALLTPAVLLLLLLGSSPAAPPALPLPRPNNSPGNAAS